MGELQRQIDEKVYTVKEGSIQDATFITPIPIRRGKRRIKRPNARRRAKIRKPLGRYRFKNLILARYFK